MLEIRKQQVLIETETNNNDKAAVVWLIDYLQHIF